MIEVYGLVALLCFFGIGVALNFIVWEKQEARHKLELKELEVKLLKLQNERADMLTLIKWLQQTRSINLPVILKRGWQEYRN